MLSRPKLEYCSPIWNSHTFSQVKSLERVEHSAARFVKNYYRRNINPADLITALQWSTLERRRIIKQATTFYKILNNIIEITLPPGLLIRSRTRGQYIASRCRINAMVFLFYLQAIRIWNMIPPKITNKKPKIISRSYYGTPFHNTSPKLPLKHSAQRKLIHGVGMETVYVCMWQGSDSIHTHKQPIQNFR